MNIYAYMSHGDPGELADYIEGDSGPSIPDDALRGALANALRRIASLESRLAMPCPPVVIPRDERVNVRWGCPLCGERNAWHWMDEWMKSGKIVMACDACGQDSSIVMMLVDGVLVGGGE